MISLELKRLLLITVISISSQFAYPVNYYVNDALGGDEIWCSAAGNDVNNGTATNTPKATVADVLNDYDIEPGDVIYIDAGSYAANIIVTSADGNGSAGNYITFQGAGRTKTIFTYNNFVFDIQASATYIKILDMKCVCTINNHVIITSATSPFVHIENCELVVNPASATTGVQLSGNNSTIHNCTITSSGFGIRLLNCSSNTITKNIITNTFNNTDAIGIWINNSNTNTITNNKCYASGPGEYGLQMVSDGDNNIIKNNYFANYRKGVYCNDGACTDNTFYYNSIYATEYAFWGRPRNWNIQSNIFYTTSNTATHYCYWMNTTGDDPTTLNYNLYYHPNAAKAGRRDGVEYTALSDIVSGTVYEDNGVEGDPLYTTPASGNLDLSLVSSPAVDNASDDAAVVNDVRYGLRTAANHDIGAYEFGATLPIELVSFTAKPTADKVKLQWATASEVNNDYFVLERSEDAVNFYPVGIVDGAGNSTQLLHYSFYDYEISAKNMYYRLKQVDHDGTFSYSRIIAVQTRLTSFSVYPALVPQDNFELMIHHEKMDGPVNLLLYAYTGALIASEKKYPDSGDYIYRPGKIITPGCYILKITTPDGSFQEKIIVY